jgi:hypothetical protein
MVGLLITMRVVAGRSLRVTTGPIFGWLSMEGILVWGREATFTRGFRGIRLGHLWRSPWRPKGVVTGCQKIG